MSIPERLEYLRGQLRRECMSWGEIHELQSLIEYIDSDDMELLEGAGMAEEPSPGLVRVIRRSIATGQERIVAGYTGINLRVQIQFLDRWAAEEARSQRLEVRNTTRGLEDGTTLYHRTLSHESDGDVTEFFLRYVAGEDSDEL